MKILPLLSVLAVLAGCRAVRDARDAQAEAAPVGQGPVVRAPVRLDGCFTTDRVLVSRLCGFALTNRPDLVETSLALEQARLALRALDADAPLASATPWRALGLSLTGGHGESSASAPLDDLPGRTRGRASAALSLDVLVWDFGRHRASSRALAENALEAELTCLSATYDAFEDVSGACFSVLESEATLAVARTNVLEYAERLRQVLCREETGDAKKLDVTRARLDLATAREQVVLASNAVLSAEADFLRALGIDAARGARADVFGPLVSDLSTCYRVYPATTETVEDAYARALTNAPSLAIARARVRSASAALDAAIADLAPTVSASLSLDWSDPLALWRWTATGFQSVFDGYRRSTAVDRARVTLETAVAGVARAEQSLSADLRKAVAERDTAREAFATACESVGRARENLETVREQYRLGEASGLDYTTAVSGYSQALAGRATAFYRGQTAESKLFALTGDAPRFDERTIRFPGEEEGK